MDIDHRFAIPEDLDILGVLNRHLIEDEGHSNAMGPSELTGRMRDWLETNSHRIVIFSMGGAIAGYAVYRPEGDEVYLRQVFVRRQLREQGLGTTILKMLEQEYFGSFKSIRLDVLAGNSQAYEFYLENGFQDYCMTMKKDIPPAT